VHLLVAAEEIEAISRLMRHQQGGFAEWYNRRKRRKGAVWTGRYHATMVESGEHLWNCMRYINLNMVRAGVVKHPRDWKWCGYAEVTGGRSRNLALDRRKLLELTETASLEEFARNHEAMIDEAIASGTLQREPEWTEAIGVGSREFVTGIAEENRFRDRSRFEVAEVGAGTWTVSEADPPYGQIPAPKVACKAQNRAINRG
jgi:putative transposase